MKCDDLVEYEGTKMSARAAARKSGFALSTVLGFVRAGKPIARKPHRGKEPIRAMYDGKMMTAKEIAAHVGLAVKTVRHRIKHGLPLGHIPKNYDAERFLFRGEMVTAAVIAKALGRTTSYVYYRINNNLPLEGDLKRGRPTLADKEQRLLESGEHKIIRGNGENGLYWADDLEARVWHLYCGGDAFGDCTLAEVGALWNLSREAVRLVEVRACAKIRAMAARGDKGALALLELFELRSEQRRQERPGQWEQAEMNSAPDVFDGGMSGRRLT